MGFNISRPVSERAVPRDIEGLASWADAEVVPLLQQLSNPSLNLGTGNHILLNLDPLGAGTVRYNVRLAPNPGAPGATETTALYIRTDHGLSYDVEDRFNGGIYLEVDQYQFLAGNGATKTIHRGWGDAHFVALMNTGDNVPIVDASNTTPIVVTCGRKHGFGHDNVYLVTGVTGNTAANSNAWYGCRVLDEYRIELWTGIGVPPVLTPIAGNGTYTGGGSITCINSQVAYEAAHFAERFSGITDNSIGRANGAVGFLSSIQAGFSPTPGGALWESGMARNKLFEALVENDQLFTGGCFVASDTPNRALVMIKRQYFKDLDFGGQTMATMEEAYYNPQANDGSATAAMPRWRLFNDASMTHGSLLSSAGTPLRNAPMIRQFGAYWDGAQSLVYGMRHVMELTAASAGQYEIQLGREGFEAPVARFTSTGSLVLLGATPVLDMQLGRILAASDIAFRDSIQGQSAAASGGTPFRDGPDVVIDGTYWDGAASHAYGTRMRFAAVSAAPKGHLMFMFGEPPTETPLYFLHDNGNVGLGGTGDDTDNYGDGEGVLFMAVAGVEPPSDPVGGGILYINAAGDLMYRTLAGNIRTVAAV